ncbi:U-box domain-containing protein 4 [Rhynchospora pubera]|uniref:U-box domain-containing protein 4 n=1 Tax=Rhynchospora pubera TaxID=906938 RepID=A0AAV8EN56_9POAL|nr:U-box domain-containing protein 4 [Rhynchospora pubera]
MESPRSEFTDSASNGEELELAADSIMDQVRSDDGESRIKAAKEIRRLAKTSSVNRRLLSNAIEPLVEMVRSGRDECAEAAILALLNLGVKDERNKINIVKAGALDPIINLLQSQNQNLQENATATILTLTACSANKPAICSSGAIPLLVSILSQATNPQTKIDSLMALYNLSTLPDSLPSIVSSNPIPSLVTLLKTVRKSSKTAEKCMALLEPLLGFESGRAALTTEPGGVLSVVELLEEGSPAVKEFAVCALLTMCESDRERYREVILKEGVIPGLLELSVKGTTHKSRSKARVLLQLLRNSPRPRPELEPAALENIVSDIVLRVDGGDRAGKAKKMLAEMVQVSMEQSLRHMQQRALICTPNPSK